MNVTFLLHHCDPDETVSQCASVPGLLRYVGTCADNSCTAPSTFHYSKAPAAVFPDPDGSGTVYFTRACGPGNSNIQNDLDPGKLWAASKLSSVTMPASSCNSKYTLQKISPAGSVSAVGNPWASDFKPPKGFTSAGARLAFKFGINVALDRRTGNTSLMLGCEPYSHNIHSGPCGQGFVGLMRLASDGVSLSRVAGAWHCSCLPVCDHRPAYCCVFASRTNVWANCTKEAQITESVENAFNQEGRECAEHERAVRGVQ